MEAQQRDWCLRQPNTMKSLEKITHRPHVFPCGKGPYKFVFIMKPFVFSQVKQIRSLGISKVREDERSQRDI